MIRTMATTLLIGITLGSPPIPAQAASMVEFAKQLDELHKYGEFKRADPERAAILAAPSRPGSMVDFARKTEALKEYGEFRRWCRYIKHDGHVVRYTCDHPTW